MQVYTKKMWAFSAAAVIALTGCGGGSSSSSEQSGISDAQKSSVLATYADTATQSYAAAYTDAVALKTAVDAFAANPTEETLEAAKDAWLASRESYGVTEIFRLSEGPIDAEEGWVAQMYGAPEGQINAWPLDENMIDYTEAADGSTTDGNIIDTVGTFTPEGEGGTAVDVTTITSAALTELNENGGDANVATGYHAIEFLLWGQDQDYNSFIDDTVTNGAAVAGQRPIADFISAGFADRRLAYLKAASQKLVDDLKTVADGWSTEETNCTSGVGCYRGAFLGELTGDDAAKNIAHDVALRTIMAGMGVFIKSELANERIAVAVLTPSEEDEHSCFSDNTHRDIALNYRGFVNVIMGVYGGESMGTSMYSLLDTETKTDIDSMIASIDAKVSTVNSAAETVHFDYQIKPGSDTQATIVAMKNEMRDLGDEMVDVSEAFGISLSEDDVTDPDETQI
jgi:putative iron-regulated protein